MSNGLEPWMLGKNIMIKATPLDVTIDGTTHLQTFSDNALGTVAFTGRIDEHSETLSYNEENISPTDCGYENPVTLEQSYSISITEIAAKVPLSGSTGNKLRKLMVTSSYLRVIVEEFDDSGVAAGRGSSTGFLQRAIMYVKASSLDRQAPKGKNTFTGMFKSIAVADGSGGYKANPYYTTTYATVDIP